MKYRTRRAHVGRDDHSGFGCVPRLAVPQRIPAMRASFLDGELIPAFSLRDLSPAVRSRSCSLTEAIELSKPAGKVVPTGERLAHHFPDDSLEKLAGRRASLSGCPSGCGD